MITAKPTNASYTNVDSVDFDGCHTLTHNGKVIGIDGSVRIELANGTIKDITGEHGLRDYVQEFGFIIEINA
jgi:hypothetical protein